MFVCGFADLWRYASSMAAMMTALIAAGIAITTPTDGLSIKTYHVLTITSGAICMLSSLIFGQKHNARRYGRQLVAKLIVSRRQIAARPAY